MNEQHGDPATWRCDICTTPHLDSPIRWTYRTADSLDAEQRARLLAKTKPGQTSGMVWDAVEAGELPGFVFQDPEWAVCQPCHELIQDGDMMAIIERNLQQFAGVLVLGPEDAAGEIERMVREAQEEAASILMAFWTHRVGDPEPVTA